MQWLNTTEYPFQPQWFESNGHKLHYVEEGKGEVMLYVHGTPSWSYDFRHCISALASHYTCIAMDHIGFGLSDKPKEYPYSTQMHSQNLIDFIQAKDLRNITLVVHDFGGPIGLNAAIQMPERFSRLVIMNSWLWSASGEPAFEKMKKFIKSPLLPFLYLNLNFSPRFILPRSYKKKRLSKPEIEQFTKPFASKSERYGALAFAQSLVDDQIWFQELWESKSPITKLPTLFFWGMLDDIISPDYLSKFVEGFPNHTIVKAEQSGHFPQDEEPNQLVEAILNTFGN